MNPWTFRWLTEVSPEWLGHKLGTALSKIEKAGTRPVLTIDKKAGIIRKIEPSKIRGKYNRVIAKSSEYNKKKYSGKMLTHMQGRFDSAFGHGRGIKKSIGGPPPGASLSGWKE